jgi:hypothetical protein
MKGEIVRTIAFYCLLTLIVLLASCSPNSPVTNTNVANTTSRETTSDINPCSLLTQDEISAVLGQPVNDGKVVSTPRPNCNYAVGDGSVTVFVFSDPSAAGGFEVGKTMQDAHTEAVADVGDAAYWSPDIKTLNVLKGKVYFTVQYYGVRSGSKETIKALAQKIVPRLP